MKNRWDPDKVSDCKNNQLGIRVYTSNLLGAEQDLVLHGGGNTSVKGTKKNVFGEDERVLYVKGSGWDLSTIEKRGFSPTRLEYLLRLAKLSSLSDNEMMTQLRIALLDPKAPIPSIEAILHALIPYQFVDHSHADAVVTISNTPKGDAHLRQIYGEDILILPYIMPGFILAKQVAEATSQVDWSRIKGIVLLHHGVFTFADSAKASYEKMIELVTIAEKFLEKNTASDTIAKLESQITENKCLQMAKLRRDAGDLFGGPMLARLDNSLESVGFSNLDNVKDLVVRGPLTPDHTIHTKAFGAIFGQNPADDLDNFSEAYQEYFQNYAHDEHQILDCMPRYGVWLNNGMVYLSGNVRTLNVVENITQHTIRAIQLGEALGGWQALPRNDLFEIEYWELEQAKLKSNKNRASFEGKVVLITGASSGIGAACVNEFVEKGAAVIAIDFQNAENFESSSILNLRCDVTDSKQIADALLLGVKHFGGIDILISNAGSFPPSQVLDILTDENWDKSIELNLSSHMRVMRACVPYLREGFDPSVVIIASKNVPAPGPGAAAYSSAKAGLTQLARVAALELGKAGIRVNVLHPNAVYDTAMWTEELLSARAASYGLSIEDYKTANLLKLKVTSKDVARAVSLFAGTDLAKTTGSQLPIDAGNDRVI
jgi:rhamnose utilization protein RhaD (predicted bifunctional aldolase and dehydrogenase)/NAD(P)-dependent dehydrogenase (short-subunit alcohol dehydrogenase family)